MSKKTKISLRNPLFNKPQQVEEKKFVHINKIANIFKIETHKKII